MVQRTSVSPAPGVCVMGTDGPTGDRPLDEHVIRLVDQSASTALEHAAALRDHLQAVGEVTDPDLRECRAEMHRLVGDIVSLRNAAELLKRQVDDAERDARGGS